MPLLKLEKAGRPWWVLAAGLQCYCAASPAIVRPPSSNGPPQQDQSPADAAPRAEPPPWLGIAALSAPPPAAECTYTATQPWLIWQREGHELEPVRTGERPTVVDPLPFAPPPQL